MTEASDQATKAMPSRATMLNPGTATRPSLMSREDRNDALRVAIEQAAARSAESMLALRLAVEGFTADLRDAGMTPEAVLIALKKIARGRIDLPGILMRDQISTWCINEYFAVQKA
jgi:hypothetical protein